MPLLHSYTYNTISPLFGEDAPKISLAPNALANGFYAAGTLLCYTAAGAWEVWAFANDPAIKGVAAAVVAHDTNVTASGVVFGDASATVPQSGYAQSFPVFVGGTFNRADILAAQATTITVANLGTTKQTGLKLKGANKITLL
jgi:hypothetical protein